MRIGRVVGTVCLNRAYEALAGARYVILEVQDRFVLSGEARKSSEYLVCYDHLGAGRENWWPSVRAARRACRFIRKSGCRSTPTAPRFSTM